MKQLIVWTLGCFFCAHVSSQPVIGPVNLQTEHVTNPLGIDAARPRFSWEGDPGRPDCGQVAYNLIVGTDSAKVSQEEGRAWETGRQPGSEQLVVYGGSPLAAFTRYYWSVTCWDQNGKITRAPVASFETGMIDMTNWQGSWISDTRDIRLEPAAYFRKKFQLSKNIVSARVYIAVAGLYELYINGQKAGDHVLDPMYTRFDRRNLYVTYDITKLLKNGANTAGVLLGNGWYNLQSTAVWYFDKAPWRNRPCFCMDMRITYSDGSVETISTGKDWRTALSPIVFNSIYTAEHYDAQKEIPHWNESAYEDSAWQKVIYTEAPSHNIIAQAMVPIRQEERLTTTCLKKFSDTDYVFDLGRNIAGVSQIALQGPPGTVVRLKHAERLYLNGHVDMSNIDVHYRPTDDSDPFQTDIYILKGGGLESFMPHFNYKGFQYVEVTSSQPIHLDKNSLVAYFMHSDVKPVGIIKSSDTIVNKIWWAINNSYLSNLFGYPTDCPQREKNGWTGDAQIAVETGLYNFDAITIYEKWLADLRDEQQPNGVLPSIIPTDGWGYEWGNGPDWTSAIAINPWEVYLFYSDPKILADSYGNIKRYVDHIQKLYPSGLCSWGLGDWVPVKSKASVELTSTAYYYADVNILANAAKLLGKEEDYQSYHALAGNIKIAFNAKYLDTAAGIYGTGIQTEQSVPLYWGLVPENLKGKIAARLAERLIADSVQLDVGLLGTKAILNALSENGYADLAYRLASRRAYPSWGYWIVNGATTLHENWPLDSKRDISMNHIMFGEIGAWFYKGLGDIYPDPAHPGFRHILLRPNIVAGLDSFRATHQGPYGEIASGWTHKKERLVYTAIIPPGSSAKLSLTIQGQARPMIKELSPGIHTFSLDKGMSHDSSHETCLYKDTAAPVETRVDDLLERMTLQEKVAQLQAQLLFLPDYGTRRNYSVGHFRNIGHFMHQQKPSNTAACAAAINLDTRRSIEASRFGIPVLQHGEALHGAQWGMATVFPQCIGLAASFDDSLVFRVGQAVAAELRAVGVRQVYAPVINIARDPRWGRMQETYGEDVYLTSRMGVAYTKALQQGGVIATLKHFVDNYGAGGHDSYASDNSWRTLRETYLEPFRACFIEGEAGSVMAAYNSVDGIPCSNNSFLLDTILRKEWGFQGTVVSDYGGVGGIYSAHHVVDSYQKAEASSLKAGLDIMLANGYADLLSLVKNKQITEDDVDRSVRRVLIAKFRLGIMDHPYVDTSMADRIVRSSTHRQLSLEAARKTMTLLKNDRQILPLSDKIVKRIGVFGPAANVLNMGDYTGPLGGWKGDGAVTAYQGLQTRLKGKASVILWQRGDDPVVFAKTCDAVVYFATIQEGEAHDRSMLTLPAIDTKAGKSTENAQIIDTKTDFIIHEDQEKTIQMLSASGVKTIVVLQNGAPIDVRNWIGGVGAVLEAWYPGEQGGTAIAEALFGDIDPGGRLPITWPKHVGQVPIYYSVKPSGRGNEYSDDDGKPKFPFGFGLSYTNFAYSDLQMPDALGKGDSLRIKLKVTNTGSRGGDAVIQVYLHDSVASVARPIKELKAFRRVSLRPAESREVVLSIPYGAFGYWDRNLKFVVTPGIFNVAISTDAEHPVLERQISVD